MNRAERGRAVIRAADLRPGDEVEFAAHLLGVPTVCTVEHVFPLAGGALLVCYRRPNGEYLRLSADRDDEFALVSRAPNTRST